MRSIFSPPFQFQFNRNTPEHHRTVPENPKYLQENLEHLKKNTMNTTRKPGTPPKITKNPVEQHCYLNNL